MNKTFFIPAYTDDGKPGHIEIDPARVRVFLPIPPEIFARYGVPPRDDVRAERERRRGVLILEEPSGLAVSVAAFVIVAQTPMEHASDITAYGMAGVCGDPDIDAMEGVIAKLDERNWRLVGERDFTLSEADRMLFIGADPDGRDPEPPNVMDMLARRRAPEKGPGQG